VTAARMKSRRQWEECLPLLKFKECSFSLKSATLPGGPQTIQVQTIKTVPKKVT